MDARPESDAFGGTLVDAPHPITIAITAIGGQGGGRRPLRRVDKQTGRGGGKVIAGRGGSGGRSQGTHQEGGGSDCGETAHHRTVRYPVDPTVSISPPGTRSVVASDGASACTRDASSATT